MGFESISTFKIVMFFFEKINFLKYPKNPESGQNFLGPIFLVRFPIFLVRCHTGQLGLLGGRGNRCLLRTRLQPLYLPVSNGRRHSHGATGDRH